MLRTMFFKKFREKLGEKLPISIISSTLDTKINTSDRNMLRSWFISNIDINPEFINHNNEIAINDYQLINSHFKNSNVRKISDTIQESTDSIQFMKNDFHKSREEVFEIEELKWNLQNKVGTYCYVLKLENDCYYVGISSCIRNRIKQHFYGHGSRWTQINKPISIENIYNSSQDTIISNYHLYLPYFSRKNIIGCHKHLEVFDLYYESYITFLMISKYGFNKVRGSILNKPLCDYSTTYKEQIELLSSVVNREIIV